MLSNLWADVRYAARTLRRNPGFSLAAIVTIALGVGITTGIFTILNGVLFRDLPAPDGHELVSIYQSTAGVEDRFASDLGIFSTAEYEIYRDRTQTLSGLFGHSDPTRTTLGGDEPQLILGLLVTCDYFDVLEQQPALGRGLTEQDCAPGADPVTVLSHDFWATKFGSDPGIIGRSLELNRQLVTVVGVAAEGTYGGAIYSAAYFAAISAQPLLLPNEDGLVNDRTSWLFLIGRRASGVSIEQARAELRVIAAQIDAAEPGRRTTLRVDRSTPLSIPLFRTVALAVGAIVMTAFGLVLLIACINVANLMLARATGRVRELALRVALGATRGRIIRQLLTESLFIAFAGGALGSVLALWSFQALIALALPSFTPAGVPTIALDSSPDMRVLVFTLVLVAGTGVLSGLAPALRSSKPDINSVVKNDTAGAMGSRGSGRLRAILVGTQVAVCMALMIGAGLLLRGLYATQVIDPGFEYGNVTLVSYDLRDGGYDGDEAVVFQQLLMGAVTALPGVDHAAFVDQAPLDQGSNGGLVRLPNGDQNNLQSTNMNWVTEDYFELVDIPILQGRAFTSAEAADDSIVAIVTESTAGRLWPGQDPIGKALIWHPGQGGAEVSLRIVGVAKDAQVSVLGQVDPYYVYLPATTGALPYLKLLVRGRSDFAATAAGIRDAMASIDPGVAATITPLESNVAYWRKLSGFVTSLAAALGTLALVLASVGIYGVVAYFVTSRFREIGIRVALGARSKNVLGFVLRRTMLPVVIGAAIGIAASVAVSGVLASMLFGVSPLDPIGLSAAVVSVLAIAITACLLASRRAVRIEPMVALRCD